MKLECRGEGKRKREREEEREAKNGKVPLFGQFGPLCAGDDGRSEGSANVSKFPRPCLCLVLSLSLHSSTIAPLSTPTRARAWVLAFLSCLVLGVVA